MEVTLTGALEIDCCRQSLLAPPPPPPPLRDPTTGVYKHGPAHVHIHKRGQPVHVALAKRVVPAVEQRGSDGSRPIHMAARAGHCSTVMLLLDEYGADGAITDNLGQSPFSLAAQRLALDVLTLLHKRGFSTDQPDSKGITPFGAAVKAVQAKKPQYTTVRSALAVSPVLRFLQEVGLDGGALSLKGEVGSVVWQNDNCCRCGSSREAAVAMPWCAYHHAGTAVPGYATTHPCQQWY